MKLPKETTLWNWAIIGLALIIGVAVIGLMNFLNEYLNIVQSDIEYFLESDKKPVLNEVVYYSGKIISIISGCFTAGAIISIARPEVNTISFVFVGFIFMILSFMDLFMYSYPLWYQLISILVIIPAVLFGKRFINKTMKY